MRRGTTPASATRTVHRARGQRPNTRQTTGTDPAEAVTESRGAATLRVSAELSPYGDFFFVKKRTLRAMSLFSVFSRPVLILLVISLLVATSLLVGAVLQYTQLRNTIRSLTAATATTNLGAPSNDTDDDQIQPKISYGRLGSRYGFVPHNNLWLINRSH